MLVQSPERVLGPVLATVDIQNLSRQPRSHPVFLQHLSSVQHILAVASVPRAAGSWEQAGWEWLVSLTYCC